MIYILRLNSLRQATGNVCIFNLVNKYMSRGCGGGFPYKKWREEIKCLRRLETCSHQLHINKQFWLLLHRWSPPVPPHPRNRNPSFFFSFKSSSKAIFQQYKMQKKRKKRKHLTPNSKWGRSVHVAAFPVTTSKRASSLSSRWPTLHTAAAHRGFTVVQRRYRRSICFFDACALLFCRWLSGACSAGSAV